MLVVPGRLGRRAMAASGRLGRRVMAAPGHLGRQVMAAPSRLGRRVMAARGRLVVFPLCLAMRQVVLHSHFIAHLSSSRYSRCLLIG